MRGSREELGDKVRDALERIRKMEKEIRSLKDKLASGKGTDLASGAVDVQGVKVVATKVDGADAGALRNAVDQLKDQLKSAVVVLASVEGPAKIVLVAGVTSDLICAHQGRRARRLRGGEGGRPRRRPAGFRAGRRHQARSARRRARGSRGVRAIQNRGLKTTPRLVS